MARDAMICPRCGNLRSECEDPSVDWHPRTAVCWASGSQEWAKRLLHEAHEKDKPERGEMHALEGRWVWVSQIKPNPDEDEFRGLV